VRASFVNSLSFTIKMFDKILRIHPLLLISAIGFLLYARALSFDYTNFDDNTLIQDNQKFISDISNLPDAFRKTVFLTGADVFYRPVQTVWLMLNAQVGGDNIFIYHFSSMLLHFFAVYFVFLFMMQLNYPRNISLLLSVFLLIHPLCTQAVAWVPGVGDVLVSIFAVCSFIFFHKFISSQQRKHFVLHVLFFSLALFTKEIAVGIIAVCLFYLHFIEREKLVSYNKKVFGAAWLVVFAVWFMMRDSALQGQQKKELSAMVFSVFENFPTLLIYIGKILLPFNLSVMPVMRDSTFIYGIISLTALSAFVFFSKEKRNNMILFGVVWFLIFFLPSFITTSTFRVHQFYEHRAYLPMIGFLFVIAEMDFMKKNFVENKIFKYILPVFLLLFFIISFRHANTFANTKTFLDNAVRTSPGSSLAHRNMGIYFQDLASKDKSLLENAEKEYRLSLSLNPYEKDMHNNLGVIYDTWGKKDLAEKEYLTETQLNPSNSQAFHNLGVLYSEKNENEKAETYLKKSIQILPNANTYQQLALLYQKMGRKEDFEKIATMFKLADNKNQPVESNSGQMKFKNALEAGQYLMEQRKLEDAEKLFISELQKDSQNVKMIFNLGLIYYSAKRLPDAEKVWRKAVEIDSTYIDAFNNLAISLAQQGKNMEAETVMKKLISSNPNYIDGYYNLANFYAKNGKEADARRYISELKKRGVSKEQFLQRGIKMIPELEKLFD